MRKILFFIIVLIVSCKTSIDQKSTTKKDGFNFEGCGECLDLNTGNVCTVDGTYYNSCLAICRQVKILCNGKCPCPKND